MNLKSGRLYWPRIAKKHLYFDKLAGNVRCDVAIIGAGITGALAAFHLAEAGAAVVMVDRRQHRPLAIRNRHAAERAEQNDRPQAGAAGVSIVFANHQRF
jgi:glycine/D-amino acid oxidase-like deaminating enzyme